ncbi:MAG: hypothetical protein VB070_04925 [Clostridiaceae bacterium]|nr:hypothetical protein [Clostridiaceae bacterium]
MKKKDTSLLWEKILTIRLSRITMRFRNRLPGFLLARSGFGINEVIGIAAGIIIAAVVVIPGLQVFARDVLKNLTSWWNDMATQVFATT